MRRQTQTSEQISCQIIECKQFKPKTITLRRRFDCDCLPCSFYYRGILCAYVTIKPQRVSLYGNETFYLFVYGVEGVPSKINI